MISNKDRQAIKESILHYLCDDWNNHKRGNAHSENQSLFDRADGHAHWNCVNLEMVMEKVVDGIWSCRGDEENVKDSSVGVNQETN